MIENKILNLQKAQEKDREFYNRLYTDKNLMQFVSSTVDIVSSNKSFDITLKKMSLPKPLLLLFVITINKNDKKIGVIGLRWNKKTNNEVEIGTVIAKPYQKQGYGNLAKETIIHYAFNVLGINKIFATCDQDNNSANISLEKLNFRIIKNNVASNKNCHNIRWQLSKTGINT